MNRNRAVFTSFAAISLALAAPVKAAQKDAALSDLRVQDLLWRQVESREGETLGGISDVLVQLPSGRLMFLAIDPAALFQPPKIVPPGALSGVEQDPASPVRLEIAKERWLFAPMVDWDGVGIIDNTAEGSKVYAFYQQAWRDPDPSRPPGLSAVGSTDQRRPARYVSLNDLLGNRVVANSRQHVGYIRDFVLDWEGLRATHALISPQFVPPQSSGAEWFAVPITFLTPPRFGDAIVVNSDLAAFRNAAQWRPETGSTDRTSILRYPAPPQISLPVNPQPPTDHANSRQDN